MAILSLACDFPPSAIIYGFWDFFIELVNVFWWVIRLVSCIVNIICALNRESWPGNIL